MAKLKLALYWASSCGGCEVAVLDVHEKILDIVNVADILFWPVALDYKYHHLEALEDKFIDVCLFNGAIRNSEQEKMARLFRKKSKVMVAFGACSCFGGIPGLANLFCKDEVLKRAYSSIPPTDNPKGTLPQPASNVPEGELELPEFYNIVSTLAQVVDVEYFIPGCPPPPDLILKAVDAIVQGNLPPAGSTIAGAKTLCDECKRKKSEKIMTKFVRTYQVIPDKEKCFLEQGIICCGPATRGGCGQRCINANMPCRGCFGPGEGVMDQGAKLLSAISSIYEAETQEDVKKMVDSIADPIGTFYQFALPHSLLKRKIMSEAGPRPFRNR